MKDTKAKDLLEKYWAAETNIEEEERIRNYFKQGLLEDSSENQLFAYFDQTRLQTSTKPISIKSPRQIFIKRAMSIAAGLLILASTLFLLPSNENHKVVEDPEQALEVTMTALGYLNGSIDRSELVVKEGLTQFDKTRIFTFYNKKEI